MPLHTRSSARIAAALLALAAAGLPASAGPLDPYLPKSGTIAGHTVKISISPEDQALSRRMRQAVQENIELFKKAVAAGKPGDALPYDPHMGITEAEYAHLLALRPTVTELAPVKIEVVKQADGGIGFKPQDAASASLADVVVAPDEKSVTTPFGTLATVNDIHQRDAASPLGAWDGVEWAQVMPPGAVKPSAKVIFGRRAAEGRGILYYQVEPFAGEGERSILVFYTLD